VAAIATARIDHPLQGEIPMRTRHPHWFRRAAGGVLIALISLVGLASCRGGWHDPERAERKMDHVIGDVEDDLELRPEQQPAYRALTGKIKSHALERMKTHRDGAKELKAIFEQPQVDADRVAAILKQEVKRRSESEPVHVAIIDEATAFYRTLDPEQQAAFNKKARRLLEWHD
jgi:Spy/CpxP family protein refolding chaperone